ncbi:PREDICTED: LRR receptor-like serine/threonine-protein kinase GSO1 [Ipomoea nil]|uniref:LRR receptor-like serine/threonine-protein kinase GSO1 n=1 Tax=Ipomoea nil TaxID=35883 RepID=UPI000901377E|nr:PREDICTED: LRR receptor-like serine/threonine-protein kinase GSO1 [Ipomoea nil]
MGTLSLHQIDHFLIIFFTFVLMGLCICSGINHDVVCKEEKRALLCFKKESKAPMNWVDKADWCSKWEGVVCDNVTGHVIELSLGNLYFGLKLASPPKGKLSSCLLELKQLRYLDLSGLLGYFGGSPFPNFLGSLVNLQYLDLSNLGFQGVIPHQLGNLSSLHTLRLESSYYDSGFLNVDTLHWLSSLSNLEYLDLSYVNLSMAHNWQEVVNTLPFLHKLYLDDCYLPKPSNLLYHNISSSLQVLDLSYNEFNSVIPKWIFNLNNLVSLFLPSCGFLSPFPDGPWNLTSLKTLAISDNELNGSLPNQLFGLSNLISLELSFNQFQVHMSSDPWNLTSLKFLDISQNQMNDSLPNQLFGLSGLISLKISQNQFQSLLPSSSLNLTSLKLLDASNNHLNSHIPNWIYGCTNLEELHLSYNQLQGTISNSISNLTSLSSLELDENMLTGEIPTQIGKLHKLQVLSLSGNRFYGPLPQSLGYLFPVIEYLSISNNMLEGIVTESHFVNLSKLRYLEASGNRLILNVSPNWKPPFQLSVLLLRGWRHLGSQFPAWLQSQQSLSELDISNAGIKGEVPTWFWNFSSEIQLVNLSHNQLHGKIPNVHFQSARDHMDSPILVYLNSNQFGGPLPRISTQITELDLSSNTFSGDVSHFLCHFQNVPNELKILHLGGNDLSGEIPECWMHWPHLEVINLSKNKLDGNIPDSIGLLNQLRSLDLHKNLLSGHIHLSLQNCTLLLKVDLGENRLTGKIPRWLGARLSNLTILRLRSNKFYGELPQEFCHLTFLRILDLANNKLFGVLPKCLQNLTSMMYKETQGDYGEIDYSVFGGAFGESALVTTKGHEYEYNTLILLLFASMDLSSNNFVGSIPIELTNLVALRSLNLSRNRLTGNIPKEMGNMNLLDSLDLSRNQLSGEIPSSFSNLSALGVLDLSYNNLSGKIPSSTQLQSFNASCYIGNNLCGLPLSQACRVDDGEIPKHENDEGDDDSEVDWFYVSMAIGFVVGFWVTCGSLFLVRSWRNAFFQFLDNKLNSFIVWVRVLWNASIVVNK